MLSLYWDFRAYCALGKSTWQWLNAAEPEERVAFERRITISPVEEVSDIISPIARRWSKKVPLLSKPGALTVHLR